MRDYTEYRGSIFDNEKKIWNRGATSKLEFNYEDFEDYKREVLKNIILKNVNMKSEVEVLDIETNNGFFATIMAEEGHSVTATDSSSKVINLIDSNLSRNKIKINFRTMDKNALDFNDNTFDLIITKNIMWQLQSPEVSFREWRRVLKDDGVLIYFDSNWSKDKSSESRPTLDKEILKKCGFSDISVDEKIYKKLWHEKGVLPYNPKSIFMVIAKK